MSKKYRNSSRAAVPEARPDRPTIRIGEPKKQHTSSKDKLAMLADSTQFVERLGEIESE